MATKFTRKGIHCLCVVIVFEYGSIFDSLTNELKSHIYSLLSSLRTIWQYQCLHLIYLFLFVMLLKISKAQTNRSHISAGHDMRSQNIVGKLMSGTQSGSMYKYNLSAQSSASRLSWNIWFEISSFKITSKVQKVYLQLVC